MKDKLPHHDFRVGSTSWKDFLNGFSSVVTQKTVLSPLTPSDLADLFTMVEKEDIRVESVFMNAVTYSDVRKWGRDVIDIRIEKKELQKGWMASIWGAYIIVNKKVPNGVVLVTSEDKRSLMVVRDSLYNKNLGKICAKLELEQEKCYNLEGLNVLRNEAMELSRRLNNVYSKMNDMLNHALTTLKKRR